MRARKGRLLGDLSNDLLSERQSSGGPRRGGVADGYYSIGARDNEVGEKITVSVNRLCPHPGSGLHKIAGLNRWHIPLEFPEIRTPVQRPPGFHHPSPPMPSGQPPHSRQTQEFTDVPRVDVTPPVAVTRKSQHGIGSHENLSMHGWSEVDAEERISRIWKVVDESIHEFFGRADKVHVLAAKGNDRGLQSITGCSGQPIGLETGADDRRTGGEGDAVTGRDFNPR